MRTVPRREYDEALAEIDRLRADMECMERQRTRLQSIVDKLPKLADGVPAVPGMEPFAPDYPRRRHTVIMCIEQDIDPDGSDTQWGMLYSTREAAEAARAQP